MGRFWRDPTRKECLLCTLLLRSPTTRLHIVRFPPPALKFTYHPEFNNDDPRLALTCFAMSIPQTRVHLRNTGEWPHVGFMAFPMVNPCESHRWGRISTWGSRAGSHGQGAAAQRGVAPKPTIFLGRGLRKSPIVRFGLWMFMLPKKLKKTWGWIWTNKASRLGAPHCIFHHWKKKHITGVLYRQDGYYTTIRCLE